MISVKGEILQSLESSDELLSLLGGSYIYQIKAPDDEQFPRITFFEITNFDNQFADDHAIFSDILVQIDIWNKTSTTTIALEVDKIMKSIGYYRTSASDFYEDDTDVYHKAMRYRVNKEVLY